jgi:methylmalonyl-CoA mutase C-terminal domain/subunit
MEVIYTSPWQAVDAVVNLAIEEDVDVIGVSSLATDHHLIPKLMNALGAADLNHVAVVVGGIIPPGDEQAMLDAGVARIFHPGSAREQIVDGVRHLAEQVRTGSNPV